jgi:hypothetical protein
MVPVAVVELVSRYASHMIATDCIHEPSWDIV